MGKQLKAKKSENFGKGMVTPVQIAFIVDRYLSDNNYSETRSVFRNEASSLISKSPVKEAPKNLLSLGAILNEYISLKEQKVMVDQERVRLEQEKCRVQTLLQGMQNAMNAYNAGGSSHLPAAIPAVPPKPTLLLPQTQSFSGSPAGFPVYKTPNVHQFCTPSNINTQPANLSSPITSYPPSAFNKRKGSKVVSDAPPVAKRSRSKLSASTCLGKDNAAISQESGQPSCLVDSSPNNCVPNGSSVAKCLFNQPSISIPSNSSGPKTPPRANSSQSDKAISPLEEISSTANCSNDNTPEGIATTRCTVISSKRVTVSPCKQIAYSMERNHCISTDSPVKTNLKWQTKRDHVKGRLDFDGSDAPVNLDQPVADQVSTSESEREIDLFDIDLPNLDAIGADFSFTEMLGDFDFECEEMGYSCQPTMSIGAPMDTASGSSPESTDGNMGANQFMSEFSSTVTEILSQKDMSMQGPDSLTAVKSVTRCITIISPVKNRGSPPDQK